jgi:hypothetical protein
MATIGSSGGLIVWMSQCAAFIQYRRWLFLHKDKLTDDYLKYNRWEHTGNEKRYNSLLAYFQPVVAWLGLLGCFLIVFIFSTASWWDGKITFQKVAVAYGGVSLLVPRISNTSGSSASLTLRDQPLILLIFWLMLKARTRRRGGPWCVSLDPNWDELDKVIGHLERLIDE